MRVTIVMPVFDDWPSALQVSKEIDAVMRGVPEHEVSVLLVDDGSVSPIPETVAEPFAAIRSLRVLALRRNLGHQRAIAIGLAYAHAELSGDCVVVMDSDGEDRPEDIPLLIEHVRARGTAVFAERGKRLESLQFRSLYQVYRVLHSLVTGREIRFGNFSALPWRYLGALVAFPELWNHYAATVVKSRLPYGRVRCDRGRRRFGEPKMSLVNLVVHGLSALFANQELVATRILVMIGVGTLVILGAGVAVVAIKTATSLALPGWATSTMGLLLILTGQALTAALVLVFGTMGNRSNLGFLPIRDYAFFIDRQVTLVERR